MARHSWPEEGQAPDALRIVVKDHGTETLSDGPKLNNVLQDLIPGMRRESSVLVAAADADIASVISARIGQRMSTAAAVAQAADYLEDRTALTTEACEWAARQMARAMGVKGTAPAVIRVEAPTKPAPRPVPMTMGRGADPARSGWLKAARGGGPVAAQLDALTSWTENSDPGIKFYSGTATYQKDFEISQPADKSIYIDL